MRKMLILLAGASLIFAGACSGDDDDDTATGGDDAADAADALGDADGYNAQIEDNFMSQCVPAAAGVADAEGMCQCTYDAIVENVPFDEFVDYDQAVREDPSATPPQALIDATTECAAAAATTTP